MGIRLLIIDRDPEWGEKLKNVFSDLGHEVIHANDFEEGLRQFQTKDPDFIIADYNLSKGTVIDLCRAIRATSKVPILALSDRGVPQEVISVLNHGADDFVSKPVDLGELQARVRAILRRTGTDLKSRTLRFNGLEINLLRHTVEVDGARVSLSALEFEVLRYFVERPGQTIGREELERLRGMSSENIGRSMDVLISRLRQKLNDNPRLPRFFKTLRGSGYLFIPSEEST